METGGNMRSRIIALLALTFAVALVGATTAHAGCGCSKPPPPIASIRPSVVYAGAPVTLFSPAFVEGTSYSVTFTAGTAVASVVVGGQAILRRDLADGQPRPQLVVD